MDSRGTGGGTVGVATVGFVGDAGAFVFCRRGIKREKMYESRRPNVFMILSKADQPMPIVRDVTLTDVDGDIDLSSMRVR